MTKNLTLFKKTSRQKGFTLVEVIVVAIIVAIIVSFLTSVGAYTNTVLNRQRHRLMAMEFANAVMEDLVFELPFNHNDLNTTNSHTVENLTSGDKFWENYDMNVTYQVDEYPIDLSDPTNLNDAKQINMTVTWTEIIGENRIDWQENLTSIKVRD